MRQRICPLNWYTLKKTITSLTGRATGKSVQFKKKKKEKSLQVKTLTYTAF